MVYETDFYTRRAYSTRPVVSSYSVSKRYRPARIRVLKPFIDARSVHTNEFMFSSTTFYPVVEKHETISTAVYSASYPIYSYTPRFTHSRIITSPIRTIYSSPIIRTRVISSPIRTTRVISSPVRTITTRVYTSPERTVYSSPLYTSPISSLYTSPYLSTYSSLPLLSAPLRTRIYESPVRVYETSRWCRSSLTPERVITSPFRTLPSVLSREYDRIAHRVRPGLGYHHLNSYLNSEPFINFESETRRIRDSANHLIREIHTPVRRARSATPFPALSYEPTSKLALDSYVARITNPNRHLAKEVHNITAYPESPRKYFGKSHLSSIKIVGDRAYNIRNPLYNPDKIRTDINLMSQYINRNKLDKVQVSDKVVVSNEVEAVEA